MITASRILATTALLLIGGATIATPAQAQDGCTDGLDGVPICTSHVGPPPPPNHLRPAPLPPPGLDNSPREAPEYQAPAAPAPVYVAPAPYVQPPAAPQPAYKAPSAPAPVQNNPVPVQGQAAITPNQPAGAPAAVDVEAAAAPKSGQDEVEAASTSAETATPSADVVAAPVKQSALKPVMDIEDSGTIVAAADQVSSDAVDATPVVLGVGSVIVIGGVAWIVLHFGPGINGIRGVVRGLLRR